MLTTKPLVGVTGTNGKTTTLLILNFILQQCGLKPLILNAEKIPPDLENNGQINDCFLMEITVEALRRKKLAHFSFDCGAFTNLTLDHLASCRTAKHYLSYKAQLLQQLAPGAKAIINADDGQALSLAQKEDIEYITYATRYPNAMVVAKNIQQCLWYTKFTLEVTAEFKSLTNQIIKPGSACIKFSLLGEHNVANAVLAASLALLFIPDLDAIAQALCKFPRLRRTMEVINDSPLTIIDDAARNTAALQAALAAAQALKAPRILLLHGIYGGGGVVMNRNNARALCHWLLKYPENHLYLTRSMHHTRKKHQVRLHEEKAFLAELKQHGLQFAYFPDLPDAIEGVLSRAQKGDLILLLGGPVLKHAHEIIVNSLNINPLFYQQPILSPWPEIKDKQALIYNPS
ncbi:MAG: hypothetical protein GX893_00125 [Firmicutes bacterium]|nr:hypothetical protein [Bacillota bacterium]